MWVQSLSGSLALLTLACRLQMLHADLAAGCEAEGVLPVAVAGRVMNKRVMGKLAFLTLRDDKGQIQVVGWADFQLHVAAAALAHPQLPQGLQIMTCSTSASTFLGLSLFYIRSVMPQSLHVLEGR